MASLHNARASEQIQPFCRINIREMLREARRTSSWLTFFMIKGHKEPVTKVMTTKLTIPCRP